MRRVVTLSQRRSRWSRHVRCTLPVVERCEVGTMQEIKAEDVGVNEDARDVASAVANGRVGASVRAVNFFDLLAEIPRGVKRFCSRSPQEPDEEHVREPAGPPPP